MLSFTDFCKFMTHKSEGVNYEWFIIPNEFLRHFTAEELGQLGLEPTGFGNTRAFYPKDKYKPKPRSRATVERELQEAACSNNIELMQKLVEELSKL